ncbi:DUF567-domain-containing protein [Mycena kentingensis (nom. inval.)]|nr:DUF567-domain-containing protein [Mycena kentingensis (nom. inval.)]
MGKVAELNAPKQAIGVWPEYCTHTQAVGLSIREKKFSLSVRPFSPIAGDSFNIDDVVAKKATFKVSGKSMTLHGRKKFIDIESGKEIFTLVKRHWRLRTTFEGITGKEQVKFTITKKFFSLRGTLIATFTNAATKQPETLVLTGSIFDRKAEIKWNNQTVGRISRKFGNFAEFAMNQQTYILSVAPNVDKALLVALCVVLDETQNEKQRT